MATSFLILWLSPQSALTQNNIPPVRVGVSCSLPHSVLLGTDVPGVFCHLADEDATDVFVVTRAQRLRQAREEALQLERQLESEAKAGIWT